MASLTPHPPLWCPSSPTRCRHQVHISHPGAQGFHHSTSAPRALFSSLHHGPLLPKLISHQPCCLLATYQPQAAEHKKHHKDTRAESFSTERTQRGNNSDRRTSCIWALGGRQRPEVKRANLGSATNFQKWARHVPLSQPPFLKNEEGGREYICFLCFCFSRNQELK